MSFKFLSAVLTATILVIACTNESQTSTEKSDSATIADNDKTKNMKLEPKARLGPFDR